VAPIERFEVSFASTDEEAVELHQFLCIVAQPVLMAPIDAQDSITEVVRVMKIGAAINARLDGHLIGVLGIIAVPWWYNRQFSFMADRFFFVLPQFEHLGVGARLLAEAKIIADQAGMDLVITGHLRRRSNGVVFTRPNVHRPQVN
jgi:GNAT superfamily N-acetyltransferase